MLCDILYSWCPPPHRWHLCKYATSSTSSENSPSVNKQVVYILIHSGFEANVVGCDTFSDAKTNIIWRSNWPSKKDKLLHFCFTGEEYLNNCDHEVIFMVKQQVWLREWHVPRPKTRYSRQSHKGPLFSQDMTELRSTYYTVPPSDAWHHHGDICGYASWNERVRLRNVC